MSTVRIDKFLADAGIGTRSEVKNYLKKGLITVNGESAKKPDIKIDPDSDNITYLGRPISYEKFSYFLLHKPAGFVTALKDNIYPTVMELINEPEIKNLAPVGRLDKDTEGLLLITNDGALTHNLLSPKKHVDKTYYALIDSKVDENDAKAFEAGVDIGDDSPTLPAKLEILRCLDAPESFSYESRSAKEGIVENNISYFSEILLTIHEGRFHQVKRMFNARGKNVVYLKRISMGKLKLNDIEKGNYIKLSNDDINNI